MSGSPNQHGLLAAVGYDLRRLHESWMELFFPRQRDTAHGVLGKWTPNSQSGWAAYRFWATVGAPIVGLLYPLALFGFATRYYVRRLDSTVTRIGILGVLALSIVVWGTLSALARYQFSTDGFLAVVAASVVATVSAVLAVVFTRIDGRPVSVLFAYPFGVTALFLPPVVAALYSPTLSQIIFPKSTTLAVWILDNVLHVGGLNAYLRDQFQLEGAMYVAMWFGLAIPAGWLLGLLVSLANIVRPK